MAEKKRLDTLLVEKGLAESRERARALVMAGKVLVNDRPSEKPGIKIATDSELRLKGAGPRKYASRGGEKLEGALDDFNLDPSGMRVLDAGASTGGFTDCLLQRGAASVCALDVGYGQLALGLRNDERVSVMERTNARNVVPADFDELFDMITIDVSFISLRTVLPAMKPLLKNEGLVISLVKPQFEAGKGSVGKGGVVRDPGTHERVLSEITMAAADSGLHLHGLAHSKLQGPRGNIEYFALLSLVPPRYPSGDIHGVVAAAWRELNGTDIDRC